MQYSRFDEVSRWASELLSKRVSEWMYDGMSEWISERVMSETSHKHIFLAFILFVFTTTMLTHKGNQWLPVRRRSHKLWLESSSVIAMLTFFNDQCHLQWWQTLRPLGKMLPFHGQLFPEDDGWDFVRVDSQALWSLGGDALHNQKIYTQLPQHLLSLRTNSLCFRLYYVCRFFNVHSCLSSHVSACLHSSRFTGLFAYLSVCLHASLPSFLRLSHPAILPVAFLSVCLSSWLAACLNICMKSLLTFQRYLDNLDNRT